MNQYCILCTWICNARAPLIYWTYLRHDFAPAFFQKLIRPGSYPVHEADSSSLCSVFEQELCRISPFRFSTADPPSNPPWRLAPRLPAAVSFEVRPKGVLASRAHPLWVSWSSLWIRLCIRLFTVDWGPPSCLQTPSLSYHLGKRALALPPLSKRKQLCLTRPHSLYKQVLWASWGRCARMPRRYLGIRQRCVSAERLSLALEEDQERPSEFLKHCTS